MSIITVKLARGDNTPWGFRLQGGKDFGTPIAIQRVNPSSLAEQGGLAQGDIIISINNNNAEFLRHKEAQDCIVKAGNSLEIRVERGGTRIWKPTVTPVGPMGPSPVPLTKTSLAHHKQDYQPVGSSHNVQAKPFPSLPSVVNKQYNSPVNLYSMQNIAETLTAQTEVLASGAKGINFMKEDKPINKGSAVYQMVHQGDDVGQSEPASPPTVVKPVSAPVTKPTTPKPAESNQSVCADCGRLIVGVFVRIKDKSLHAECFKCSTCGTSLKNVGYYNVNDKLYCDIHAKQAAVMMGVPAHVDSMTIGGNMPYAPSTPTQAPASVPVTTPKSPGTAPPFGSMTPKSPGTAPPFGSMTPKSPGTAPPFSNISPMPFHSVKAPVAPPVAPHTPGGYVHPKTAPTADAHRPVQAPGMKTPISGARPAPRRGRGQLKTQATPGTRIPICADCGSPIRGPFIVALGKTWCPDHFLCKSAHCRRPLQDIGFVEEQGQLHCEKCWEFYLAPTCCKCGNRIKGDCLNALDRQWHPECFVCAYCRKPFGNSSFYLEDGQPYCEKDWNEMFTTKCVGCGFPIEAGDRWVEALSNNYHSQCFKCTICHKNLEGQSFYAKGGRPFCKAHAR